MKLGKTELDWVILRSKEIPAGNHYFRRSNGIPPYKLPPGAPKFSITVPKTPIELETKSWLLLNSRYDEEFFETSFDCRARFRSASTTERLNSQLYIAMATAPWIAWVGITP